MGKVVEKKKKKKGRPSLLDLQKRRIKEQNENQQHDNSAPKPLQNYNPATPTPLRRSTRRNPAPDASSQEDTPGDDEDLSSGHRRREKELKLVLKLPNSGSENRGGSDLEAEEEDDGAQNQRKRKIAAIGDGSGVAEDEKGEKPTKSASAHQGIQLDSKVSTPLPDKKLLLFILDRLQKKDTYGVFSEPVDPEELPDYHEIIEHPMDFGTVRKKLESGVYSSLEQFENDVFLICSNAMQYNAPDTVYFRQARTIQELAKKNFENLRQDSDENNEPEPKRRGRPPTKHLKRPPGRPPLDRAASSDATLATGGENNASASYDLRKAQFNIDKSGLSNSLGRPRINDVYVSWLSQNRYERNDEYAGSSSKGSPMKYGKKQTIPDEDRRNSYKQFLPGTPGHEPSVLATFSRERKQLMAVGLHSDHGYARSLARFAASLGPAAWEIASKMIQRSLPNGVKFGPGWVGENDAVPQRWQQLCSGSKTEPSAVWPFSASGGSAAPKAANDDTDSREKVMESSEGQLTEALPPNQDSQPFHGKVKEAVEGSSSRAELIEPSTSTGLTMPRPQIVVQQNLIHPGSNGFNSSFSYNNLAAHMGKLIGGGSRPPSFSFHSQNSLNPNRRINEKPPNIPPSTNSKKEDTSTLQERPESDQPQQQRPSSVPPDLNIRFNSPSSPSSGRAESAQPDLALQL